MSLVPSPPATRAPVALVPRCCPVHEDWETLREHLVLGFPDLSPASVTDEMSRARSAATAFGLDSTDQLDIAEVVTRHQLMLRTGTQVDNARLDPEVHIRRDHE